MESVSGSRPMGSIVNKNKLEVPEERSPSRRNMINKTSYIESEN